MFNAISKSDYIQTTLKQLEQVLEKVSQLLSESSSDYAELKAIIDSLLVVTKTLLQSSVDRSNLITAENIFGHNGMSSFALLKGQFHSLRSHIHAVGKLELTDNLTTHLHDMLTLLEKAIDVFTCLAPSCELDLTSLLNSHATLAKLRLSVIALAASLQHSDAHAVMSVSPGYRL